MFQFAVDIESWVTDFPAMNNQFTKFKLIYHDIKRVKNDKQLKLQYMLDIISLSPTEFVSKWR